TTRRHIVPVDSRHLRCAGRCPSSSCSTVWIRSPKAKVILPFIK
ncbi:unnamed protein product, partial [Larinioides sclopetarius]